MKVYNQDLGDQSNLRNFVAGYGTMTQAEKQMNKAELKAYKEYGGYNFSLVPGI